MRWQTLHQKATPRRCFCSDTSSPNGPTGHMTIQETKVNGYRDHTASEMKRCFKRKFKQGNGDTRDSHNTKSASVDGERGR